MGASVSFQLTALTGDVRARILLNGIQVFRTVSGPTRKVKVDLNPWIIEGANRIDLFLGPDAGSGANVDLKVVQLAAGNEQKLSAYRWDPSKTPLGPPPAPTGVWRQEFTVPKAFGRWSWEDAPATDPSKDDQSAIVTLVASLYKALGEKNSDTVTALMKVKIEDLARAHGIPVDQLRQDQLESLTALFSSMPWALDPMNASGLTLLPAAGGRLLTVTDPAGKPPIRGVAGGKPVLFPLVVSRIAGAWTVVR